MEILAEFSETNNSAISRSNLLKRSRYWAIALLVLATFGIIAWGAERAVYNTVSAQAYESLTVTLRTSSRLIALWLDSRQRIATLFARQPEIRQQLNQIIVSHSDKESERTSSPPLPTEFVDATVDALEHLGAFGYLVCNRTGRCLASSIPAVIDRHCPMQYSEFIQRVMQGQTVVIPPHFSSMLGNDSTAGTVNAQTAVLNVMTPVRDSKDRVVGSLTFAFLAGGEFSNLLASCCSGQTGEVYAVSAEAVMLSPSRFETQLQSIGVLEPNEQSAMNLRIRDPGVNLTASANQELADGNYPVTQTASEIGIAAADANDAIRILPSVYRDYRGVDVLGGARWLPEYGFGLIAQVDSGEAFSAVHQLRRRLWSLWGLLACFSAGILLYAQRSQSAFSQLRRAERKLEKLGQYELLEKLGEGGMGEVYRAQHATLRRETAVKICKSGVGDRTATIRFQREVQAASQLNNPHTVRIFDYGRSPDGTFYYAMELLHGMNLSSMVRQFGPLADGRTLSILKQICESLSEAHGLGLVHRDIKPSNVMISRRGGVADFVKVLDFGLVRSVAASSSITLTVDGCVAGTPQYMSPESSQTPDEIDPRSDLYAVGCLAYYLLSGQPPFLGNNPLEICLKHVREQPRGISQLSIVPLAQGLTELVMQCLSKAPSQRPQSAMELLADLEGIEPLVPWTRNEAELWWRENAAIAQSLMVSGPDTQVTLNPATPS